jgi:anthranilate phosphoribosyltransferase
VAETLAELDVDRALVVHGAGGLDEISLAGDTQVADVQSGTLKRYTVTPEDFGVARAPLQAIRGGEPAENAAMLRAIFAGEMGPRRDIVAINAAAALLAAGVASTLREGMALAETALSSGAAAQKLEVLRAFTTATP